MLRDPLTWSVPLGRLFGINLRAHILFPLIALGLVLRVAFERPDSPSALPPGGWRDMTVLLGCLFGAVLLHELGHCFAARWVHGDAHEVLLWPLGGLASVEVPHTPRAHLVTAAAGPLTNLALAFVCGLTLVAGFGLWPPLGLNAFPFRADATGLVRLYAWGTGALVDVPNAGTGALAVLLARFFWVNWFLGLINLVLLGFPLDGGRILQSVLWKFLGYRQATMTAIFAGFLTMFLVGLFGIVTNELLPLCLAGFIYVACRQEWVALETSGEDGGLFGYDFSQGYASLERERDPTTAASPPRRRQNWWQRWQQRRTSRRIQRETEVREAEERRMDELLEKVQQLGLGALSEEERRFLKRVSDRYRNR